MAEAIEVRELRVVRGGTLVLPGVSLGVPTGAVTGLLGPSGCGKTTLMRAIVGVQIVAGGEIEVLGRPAGTAALRSYVGYVTQAPSVYGDLTLTENLRYFARVLGVERERVDEAIAAVRLERHARRIVRDLSGGEQARASLATALLNDPEVLVLDEPTVGLDPVLRRELWRMFHELADAGTTLLVSSHVMDEAANCDLLLLMRDGRILRAQPPGELLRETGSDDLAEAFLRAIEGADGG